MIGHLSDHFQSPVGAVILSLIAFSVVFLVLLSLMLLLIGVKHLAGFVDLIKEARQLQAAAAKAAAKASAPPPAAPSATSAVATAPAAGDQLIAVITAAIAASGLDNFRIGSICPVVSGSLTSGWKRLSRLDNLEGWD